MTRGIKLTRNGNATTVCIPRRMLDFLRWRAGDQIVIELKSIDEITVRRPRATDLNVPGTLGVIENALPVVSK
jgi:antitoxin component of MazEF toxin-antitoxin module